MGGDLRLNLETQSEFRSRWRPWLRAIGASVVGAMPFDLARRLSHTRILQPYYHLVSDDCVPHFQYCGWFPGVDRFKRDLDYLLRHFKPMDLRDFIVSLRSDKKPADNRFLLSFDDGYREMYEIVRPILLEKGVPATFFVNSASVDNKQLIFYNAVSVAKSRLGVNRLPIEMPFKRQAELAIFCRQEGVDLSSYLQETRPYLSSTQIATMIRDGFTFGGHSVDHAPFVELSHTEQLEQVKSSVEFLRPLGVNYSAFAFPGSDRGSTNALFRELTTELDVSFGTSSGRRDPIRNHFQRTSFETKSGSAAQIVGERWAVEGFRRVMGRNTVMRA